MLTAEASAKKSTSKEREEEQETGVRRPPTHGWGMNKALQD